MGAAPRERASQNPRMRGRPQASRLHLASKQPVAISWSSQGLTRILRRSLIHRTA